MKSEKQIKERIEKIKEDASGVGKRSRHPYNARIKELNWILEDCKINQTKRETNEGTIMIPLQEVPDDITYDILKHMKHFTEREIALAIGWTIPRTKSHLQKLRDAKLITMSSCFVKKLTWIRPREDGGMK